jgi:hypothetical protein
MSIFLKKRELAIIRINLKNLTMEVQFFHKVKANLSRTKSLEEVRTTTTISAVICHLKIRI